MVNDGLSGVCDDGLWIRPGCIAADGRCGQSVCRLSGSVGAYRPEINNFLDGLAAFSAMRVSAQVDYNAATLRST